jgi:hypothetical protein
MTVLGDFSLSQLAKIGHKRTFNHKRRFELERLMKNDPLPFSSSSQALFDLQVT